MIGPVAIQRGFQSGPTFSKEPVHQQHVSSKQHTVQKHVSNMFMEYEHFGDSSPPSTSSMKQAELYGNSIPFSEPSMQFPVKYPELYDVPKNAKYPEFYMTTGHYNESFYPVDTPNIIPDSRPAADFKQQPQSDEKMQPNNDAEMDYLVGNDGFDLSSLLSMPALVGDEISAETDPLNLLGFQPPSMDGLDLLNPAVLGSTLPDGIHYCNGIQKECNNPNRETHITADPLMTDLYGLPVPFQDSKKNVMEINTPVEPKNTLFPVKVEAKSLTAEDSPPMSADSSSAGSLANWEDGLRHLFEQTFDLSDLEGGGIIFPPPNKRRPEDSPSSNMYWSMEKTPPLTPATSECVDSPSPQSVAVVPSPPSQERVERGTKTKPKPPLLFGKHEGEIIHKLLAVSRSTKRKPITRDKLITIAVEEFNQLLEEAHLSEIEVAFMKEWRRRGKNKAAAQVARKRKREEVSGLDEEVQELRQRKDELQKRYDHLRSLVESLKKRSSVAEEKLFQKQSQVSREPVSRNTHHIHVTDDDKLLLIPRISSKVLLVKN